MSRVYNHQASKFIHQVQAQRPIHKRKNEARGGHAACASRVQERRQRNALGSASEGRVQIAGCLMHITHWLATLVSFMAPQALAVCNANQRTCFLRAKMIFLFFLTVWFLCAAHHLIFSDINGISAIKSFPFYRLHLKLSLRIGLFSANFTDKYPKDKYTKGQAR